MAVASAAFLLSRLLYLDWDAPDWFVAFYQPLDEAFYVWPAFNLADHGQWIHRVAPYVRNEAWPMNVAQNLVTWPMLKVLGDNLYGMRASSVIAGVAIAGLVVLMVKRIGASLGCSGWLGQALFWIAFLTFDFSFLMATRIVEPTIYRMLGMMILMAILTAPSVRRQQPWLLGLTAGLASAAAVVWFYPHNAFVVLAAAAVVAWRTLSTGAKNLASAAATFILGAAVSTGAWFLFVRLVYGTGPAETINYWLTGSYVAEDRNLLQSALTSADTILYSNIFRFDWALLVLALASLPFALWLAAGRLESDDTTAVPLVFAAALALQLIFVNDYPLRKMVVALPLIILTLATVWSGRLQIIHALHDSRTMRRMAIGWAIFMSAAVTAIALSVVSESVFGDVSTPGNIGRLTLLGLALAITSMFGFLFGGERFRRMIPILILTSLLLGSLWLDAKYIFARPRFTFRDTCRKLAADYDGTVVAGGCSYSMRLYNTMEPVLSGYRLGDDPGYVNRTLARLVDEGRISASFGYDTFRWRKTLEGTGLRFERDLGYITVNRKRLAVFVPAE